MVKFRDFDVFGTKLEFKLDGEEKYKSKFGAFCSLIYILSILLIGGLCFKDFFDTKNLNVSYTSKEKAQTNATTGTFALSNGNFFFAVQIYDININPILTTNGNQIIYPIPIYTHGEIDPESGKWNYKNKRLNFKKCTKEDFGNNINFDYLLNYICVDFNEASNIKIGGSWTESFIDLVTVTFKTCDVHIMDNTDIYFLNENNFNCTSEEEVKKAIDSSYIDIFTPGYKLNLDINNLTAFEKYPSNIYDYLDLIQYKAIDLVVQDITFIDDHGYFVDSPLSTEQKTILGKGSRVDYSGISLPRDKEQYIYKFDVLYSKNEYVIERRQTRLQDLIANIMGIIAIVEVIVGNLADYYNSTMMNIRVLNKIFNFYEEGEEPIENVLDVNEKINSYNKVNIKDSSKNSQLGIVSNNLNNGRLSYLKDQKEEIEDNVVNIEIVPKNNIVEYKNKSLESNQNAFDKDSNYSNNNTNPKTKQNSYELYLNNINKEKDNIQKNKLNLNYFQLMSLFCCKEKLNNNENKIKNAYEIGLKYIEERTDFMYLFDIFNQIELGKSIFLKDNLSFLLNNLRKQNLYSKKGYETIKSKLKYTDEEEVKIEEQENINDSLKDLFEKLQVIKNYKEKAKIRDIDNINSRDLFSHENLKQLINEINPIYQEVILNNNSD